MRAAVDHGFGKLRRNTLIALVDHVTETLPGPGGEFFAPMASDYIKTLLCLLSRPALVEQLARGSAEPWLSCVEFCADAVSRYLDRADQDTTLLRSSPAPGTGQSLSLSRSTGRSSSIPTKRGQKDEPITHTVLQNLLECINHLVVAPHAPVRTSAHQVVRPILRILQIRHMTIGHIHQHSFATINTVLSRIEADETFFARCTTRELIPLVSHWWHAQKVAKDEMLKSIRDEMLKVIFTVSLQLESLAQVPGDGTLQKELEDLLDTFWSEYSRRDAPSQLQLGDISFGSAAVPDDYFRTPIFSLRSHNPEGERNWAVLQGISILECVLARLKSHDRPTSAGGEQPRKRRRTTQEPSRIRHQLKSLDDGTRFTALQAVPFLAQTEAFHDDEVWDLAADLAQLLSDKRPAVASWAMLGCAR